MRDLRFHIPLKANLEWLKKQSKERLSELRAKTPEAKLSAAQLAIARDYGFASWRKLKAHVEQLRDTLDALAPKGAAATTAIAPDDADLTQLLAAVRAGERATVSQLLTRRPELAKGHGPDGQTALHLAAECNDPWLAAALLACGADPQARYGTSGHTALSWAVTCHATECAQTLVRAGVKPDMFCASGLGWLSHVQSCFEEAGTLVANAAHTGSSRLDAAGARLPCPPSTSVEQISDALYIACRNGHVEVARFLLGKQPDLAFRAYSGGTPLHWAYFGNSPEIIKMLLAAGADPQAVDDELGCTPRLYGICVPISWGIAWMVRQRLAADPNLAKLTDGHTRPLHVAARCGNTELVRLLLDAGADPLLRDGNGLTPVEVAEMNGQADVTEMLRKG